MDLDRGRRRHKSHYKIGDVVRIRPDLNVFNPLVVDRPNLDSLIGRMAVIDHIFIDWTGSYSSTTTPSKLTYQLAIYGGTGRPTDRKEICPGPWKTEMLWPQTDCLVAGDRVTLSGLSATYLITRRVGGKDNLIYEYELDPHTKTDFGFSHASGLWPLPRVILPQVIRSKSVSVIKPGEEE